MLGAAIFDMDGVLIDSEPLWRAAEMEVFATVGIALSDDDCRSTMGMRVDEVVAHWYVRRPWPDPDHHALAVRIVDRVIELVGERGRPLPGVRKATALGRSLGLRLAVASSSQHRLIRAVLDGFDLAREFEVVHSAEDEAHGKPHPGIYLTTAARLGVDPLRCVAIEDSVNGVIAAKAARMRCIAVPERDGDGGIDPRFVLADAVLPSLEELTQAHIS